ncbi:MAG: protein-disulfide reductase DsbD family protein [Saprospiraceae bacterium]
MRLFKIAAIFLIFAFSLNSAIAQQFNPVERKAPYAKHVSGNEYDLHFVLKIDDGWYVYSQFIDEGGPVPTTFEFEETAGVQRIGKVKEVGKKKAGFDKVFEMDLIKYAKKVIFKQRIKVTDASKPYTIKGGYEFMTCNDERCLSPKYFEFSVKTKPVKSTSAPVVADNNKPKVTTPKETTANSGNKGTISSSKGLPVKWKINGERLSKTMYELTFTADVKNGWELYSTYTGGSKGPMPLTVEYENGTERIQAKKIKVDGDDKVRNLDKHFTLTLTRYKNTVTFKQKIDLKKGSRNISGDLYYVASNNTGALPPQRVDFKLKLPSKITGDQNKPAPVLASEEGDETEEGDDDEEETTATPTIALTGKNVSSSENASFDQEFGKDDCSGGSVADVKETNNLWIFLLGFGGGLLALLTPCIYPMIPITVGFFTKRSKTRAQGIGNALAYGLSIIAIYVSLGLAVTGIFGPEALNKMSVHWAFNSLFFAVFVAFAFSFFGFFELTLPSSWSTWSDKAADKQGGLLGIFFMAFTLSLVSFSCTGPIIGSLLVETASSSTESIFFGIIKVKPLLGMLGFSTALALPFALFALFPTLLNSMPKSGGWMNAVKVTLGFLELALALKFLSTIDLVNHLNILHIETFLALWILIFGGLAAYMFGLLKLPLDYVKPKPNTGRAIVGLTSLAFVAYLAYGLYSYQPLTLLSGLAPPVSHNLFRSEADMEYPDCPQGIRCFKDYDEGIAYAKDRNLPVMIDFTGHGCVNCRKMEEEVWGLENIKPILENEYVLISLYVDDSKRLPKEKQYKAKDGSLVRSVGSKWAQFQIEHFGSNTQPLYVLTTANGKVLNAPVGYTPDDKSYEDFLQCGLDRFESLGE